MRGAAESSTKENPPPRRFADASPARAFRLVALRLGADVRIDIAADGTIAAITQDARQRGGDRVERLAGPVVPGMANVHSHAFQRAMAGLAEKRRDPSDSFWTWREAMYRVAHGVGPDELSAIASYLFMEMLKAGYTNVGEFHYLHNDVDGMPYADPAEMSARLVHAAAETGIGLTVLPVLYMRAGFDDAPLEPAQRRFAADEERLLAILEIAALAWPRCHHAARRHRTAFPARGSDRGRAPYRCRAARGYDDPHPCR